MHQYPTVETSFNVEYDRLFGFIYTQQQHTEPNSMINDNTMAGFDDPRHRAAALKTAFYYAECSLSGISSTNASAAEEDVRCNQSKWWLQGDHPNHPAHGAEHKELEDSIPLKSGGEEARATSFRSTEESNDNPSLVAQIDEQGDEDGTDSDWDAPIFAFDNDYPSSLPTGPVSSCQFKRKTPDSIEPFSAAATGSSLRPTFGASSQSPLHSSMSCCVEDVIRSYSAYPNHYLYTSDKPPLSRSIAHPITSESEADDSVYVSGMSHNSSASIRASSVATSRHTNRGRKRMRVSLDEDSSLDEAFLQARVYRAKKDLLSSPEDTTSKTFSESLKCLEKANKRSSEGIDGTWIMISPPDYPSCLGTNVNGDKLYTLERMSFGMYEPGPLICSIQQQFNTITSVKSKAEIPQYVPSSLKKEVDDESGKCSGRMKTYK